jgi:multicomponent Na+:H+ antiporter subunit G
MLADLFLLVGAAFSLLGALGLLRMPDVYNRIQAGTKAVTLGALSFLLGIGLLYPQWWSKLLCIAGFILFTNPVGSSTIARALYLSRVRPWSREDQGARSAETERVGSPSR